ncbi:hypothetical protein [Elioraea sp.]|uniref:hypothetical protein n=1 Tax=Elioraea sp. TaxID=2185103 RepID=UPI0025C4297C|nr:hypothetical protein [Elioraea sp.]
MNFSPAPLPEISEQGAGEGIAPLYAAIRAGLAARTVPLLYRVMAPEPGCLAWAWGIIGPLAASGVLATVGAAASRALPPITAAMPRAACRLAGLDDAGADRAAAIVAAFNHANPMNLAARAVLARVLAAGTMPRAGEVLPAGAPPPLPVMAAAALTDDVQAVMQHLASRGGRHPVPAMPTLWSALAAHPASLAIAAASLTADFANGTIDSDAMRVAEAASAVLDTLPMVAAPGVPTAIADHLGRVLPFFAATVPVMIVIGARLSSLFMKDPA